MTQLQGKVALVTGATRGIGKGIAIGLGEAGATVYITGRTVAPPTDGDPAVPGSLQETCAAVEAAGGTCIPVQTDHRDDEQVRSLFERIQAEQQGRLDLLVNNAFAGVQAIKDAYGQPFWEAEPHLWDAANNVGLRSHYVASVYAARLMSQRRQGLICTLSSWGGLSPIFGVAYGTGKAACDRLAAEMAVELKPYNVTSLAIWPGIVGTELMSRFFAEMGGTPDDSQMAAMGEGFNWETPLLTGRAIAALAADPDILRDTGRVKVVAEVAQQYGLADQDGECPASLRSLRFLLPFAVPAIRHQSRWIPDVKVPWWVLLLSASVSPRV